MPRPTLLQAKQLGAFIPNAYGNTPSPPPGWIRVDGITDLQSGFKGSVYMDSSASEAVIVIAGTQFFLNPATVGTDLTIFRNQVPPEYFSKLTDLLNSVVNNYPDVQYALAGPSLGGWGVQTGVAYLLSRGYDNVLGVTFGGLGAGRTLDAAGLGAYRYEAASKILNLVNDGDPVATWKPQIGETLTLGDAGDIWRLIDAATPDILTLLPGMALFHSWSNYEKLLDQIQPSTILLPGDWDPDVETPSNTDALTDAINAAASSTTTELPDPIEIDLPGTGEAYVLLLGEDNHPAQLITFPTEAPEQGMMVSMDRNAELSLETALGSLESIRGEANGGVDLQINPAAGIGATSLHLSADGFALIDFGDGSTALSQPGTWLHVGGQGADLITGDDGVDVVLAGSGDDTVYGLGGADQLYGGSGNDQLVGGPGNDTLTGGPGDDLLEGGDGSDVYVADGLGNDHIVDDDLTPDDRNVDTVRFTPDIAPYMVQVYWQQGNNRGIERVEFDDGTVWTWEDILKLAEPLPPGDPLGDSGPPLDDLWQIVSDLQHPYAIPTTWPTLSEIIDIWGEAETIDCPIVLDLDGDGVETRGVNAGAHFDHAGDGFKERTGWAGADDGLLAWDRNGDGQITGGSELFGNRTLLPDGVTPAANGFAALAAWDANTDGKIDANDPIWTSLRIWRDADSDGVSTPAELVTPTDLGITAINTGYTTSSTVDAQGNNHRQIGSFAKADGSTGAAEDVWFKTDTVHANSPDPIPVPAIVAALPDLNGFGTLYSLRQAMARDTAGTLSGFVKAFVVEGDPAQREALVDQILFRWTGADTVDPASRGGLIDARLLTVLEAFMGQGYVGLNGTMNPNGAALLTEAYGVLRQWTYAQLDVQTHLADLYRLIDFSWDAQKGLVGDLAPVKAELEARMAADPVSGRQDLSEFARSVVALKAEDMLGFWAFRDAFAAQDPSLQWVIDLGGRNQIIGTGASEGLNGTSLREAIRGGDGNDTLWGQQGADVLYGDAGTDLLWGSLGDDLLVGGADGDTLNGEGGRDRLESGDGDDWLYAGADNDVLLGGAGSDGLYGGDGNDTLNGGPGNDSLYGDNGADDLEGGGGSDYLAGGPGTDTYHFGRGSGSVSIREDDTTIPAVIDTIQLGSGILPPDVTLRRWPGYDLHLAINGATDQLGVSNFFWAESPGNQIEQIRFEDGTVWDVATIMQMVLQPTAGDDVLTGYSTPDTISGLDGNDQLYGRDGNDALDGGPGNDSLYGENGDDTLLGGPGDDTLRGAAGADILIGGPGNDALYGEVGADTLDGGGGSDYVDGGIGPDTYLFGLGSGSVTIRDDDYTAGVIDTIQLGPGILWQHRSTGGLGLFLVGNTRQPDRADPLRRRDDLGSADHHADGAHRDSRGRYADRLYHGRHASRP